MVEVTQEQAKALDVELAAAFKQTLNEMYQELPEEEKELVQDAFECGSNTPSEALYIDPGTIEAMCKIGYAFYNAGSYEQARSIFSLITSMDEGFYKAWRGLGACFQVNKNYDMAVAMYRQAVFTSGNSGRVDLSSKVLLGECLMLSGSLEEGRHELEEAVQLSPNGDEMSFIRRAKVILQMGDEPRPHITLVRDGQPIVNHDVVSDIVEDLAVMSSGSEDVFSSYLDHLFEQVSQQELELLCQAALEQKADLAAAYDIDRPTLDAMCQIGQSFYDVGQYHKAMPIFSLLTAISPDYYPAWRGMGAIYQINKELALSIVCYRRALDGAGALGEDDIPSLVLFGEVLLQNGDLKDGQQALTAALGKKPRKNSDMAYMRRARVLLKIGNKEGPKVVLVEGKENKPVKGGNVEALGLTEKALRSVDSITDLDNYIKELIANAPEEELQEMALACLNDGATQLCQIYGVDRATMDGICQTANAFYSAGQYQKAAATFAMLTNLDLEYFPAWRGLGAVAQVGKNYPMAQFYYRRAILAADNNKTKDVASIVFLAEVLGLQGEKEEARKYLDSLKNLGSYKLTKEDMIYIRRAKLLQKDSAVIPVEIQQGGKRIGISDGKLQKAVEYVAAENDALDKSAEMYMALLDKVSDDELTLIMNAIKDGATNLADAYGIEKPTLDAICQIGYSYYEVGRYSDAGPILGLVTMLDPTHVAAWRGLGAIQQAAKKWDEAAATFALAIHFAEEQDIVELPSKVLRGECLLFGGHQEEAKSVLEEALSITDYKLQDQIYIERAKALLNRGNNKVQPIVLVKDGRPVNQPNTDIIEGRPNAWSDEDREIEGKDILAIPELRQQAQEILEQIAKGNLTLAQVAGIPSADVDCLFKAAAVYAQNEEYENAMLIASFTYMLEPGNVRNLMFMLSVMMRMKNYQAADELANIAISLMPERNNPLYELNIGETKLMLGKKEEGAKYLHHAIELCGNVAVNRPYAQRATQLLKLYVEH